MTPIFKKYGVMMISVVAIIMLVVIWTVNGTEKEDIWFYVVLITIVLVPAFDAYSKKNKDKGQ